MAGCEWHRSSEDRSRVNRDGIDAEARGLAGAAQGERGGGEDREQVPGPSGPGGARERLCRCGRRGPGRTRRACVWRQTEGLRDRATGTCPGQPRGGAVALAGVSLLALPSATLPWGPWDPAGTPPASPRARGPWEEARPREGSHSRGSRPGPCPQGDIRVSLQKSSLCLKQQFSAMGTLPAGGHRAELETSLAVAAGNGDWRLAERGQGPWRTLHSVAPGEGKLRPQRQRCRVESP